MTGYRGLIQPIVVRRTGTHEDMVAAAARASVTAWLATPAEPIWDQWLAGPFAKTVRRARPAEVEKIRPYAVASVAVGEAEAFALLPHDKAALPREVAKLQVSGLDAERTGWPRPDGQPEWAPHLLVNADAQMTTGKTCAQAAHGLFGWALKQDPARLDAWVAAGMPFSIADATLSEFTRMRQQADPVVIIEDAGHTEVDPGTLTVLALNPTTTPQGQGLG